MVQKFPNLLVLEEADTETDSPVLRAYGLVCVPGSTVSPKDRDEKSVPPT